MGGVKSLVDTGEVKLRIAEHAGEAKTNHQVVVNDQNANGELGHFS
jgi:hypothetical protein